MFYGAAVAAILALCAFAGPVSAAPLGGTSVAQAVGTTTVTGQVSESGGAAGLSGAAVIFDGPSHVTTTTDASGNFTVTVLPGVYSVTVNKGGYQGGSAQVTAAPGSAATVNVELTESSLSNLQVIGRTATSTTG